jgi:O-antigen ligase
VLPRAAPWCLAVIVLLLGALAWHLPSWSRVKTRERLCLALCLWWAVSAARAPDPKTSLLTALVLSLIVGATLYGAEGAEAQTRNTKARIAHGILLLFGVCAVGAVFEEATGLAGRRFVLSLFPKWTPVDPLIQVVNGRVVALPTYMSNRNIGSFMLLFWPAALIGAVWARASSKGVVLPLVLCAAAFAIGLSEHQTSKVALLVSLGVFAIYRTAPDIAHRGAIAAWIATTLLILPIVWALATLGAGRTADLQFSAQHRIVIWQETARRVAEHPILGHGLGATRQETRLQENAPREPARRSSANPAFSASVDTHAHNVFLQVWYEQGVIGALLLALAGLPVLHTIARAPHGVRPFLGAGFATIVAIASLSWSMTSHWFAAALALSGVALALARAYAESNPPALTATDRA